MKTRKNGNIVDIEAVIVCERESHKRIIIGKKGAMIKEIGTQARVEMENLLGYEGKSASVGKGSKRLER